MPLSLNRATGRYSSPSRTVSLVVPSIAGAGRNSQPRGS